MSHKIYFLWIRKALIVVTWLAYFYFKPIVPALAVRIRLKTLFIYVCDVFIFYFKVQQFSNSA
jgi:hypothetical protein